jgi:hypothetical protein
MKKTLLAASMLAALAVPAHAQSPLYIEGFAGAVLMDSTITVGGVKLVDQGGDALMGGLRAGYRHRFGTGLVLGFEGDAWVANGRSRAVVNGEQYSRRLGGGAGLYGRVGLSLQGRETLYLRAGVQWWEVNGSLSGMPAVGGGAEVPFGGAFYGRVDLTYAWDGRGVEHYQGTAGIGLRF